MAVAIRVILGDPGSVAEHPSGPAAHDAVVAANLIPGVLLPGVLQINIRTGRSHPADAFPGGQASITVDVTQLGTTDMVRDITARLIEASLETQTGRRLPRAWQPADSLVEFVTVIADISWQPADRSATPLRAWWPLFSGGLRRLTRSYGRTGQDLLTLDAADSSVWLGASTGAPITGTFTAWPQESVVNRLERILTAAVYPSNRLTGGVVDPGTTAEPDGATPRKRRVRIQEPTTRMVAQINDAPPGSLLAEARETVVTWAGDLFWHHGIGDITSRDSTPDTVTMTGGATVQTDFGDLLVLAGATLDEVGPSVTRSGFASPVIFGAVDPLTRPDNNTSVVCAYSQITDQIDASKTTSVTRWARIGGDTEIRASRFVSDWIRRVGWRTSERTETLHATDSDRQLMQEFFEHEHVRPRRIWRWETTVATQGSSEIEIDRQLAMAMTSLRHRVSLAVPQSDERQLFTACHIEQVSHRITPALWTTGFTGVPAASNRELRGWGRRVMRRDTGEYVVGISTEPFGASRSAQLRFATSLAFAGQWLHALNGNDIDVYDLTAPDPHPNAARVARDVDPFPQDKANQGRFPGSMVVGESGRYLYALDGATVKVYDLALGTPMPPVDPPADNTMPFNSQTTNRAASLTATQTELYALIHTDNEVAVYDLSETQ